MTPTNKRRYDELNAFIMTYAKSGLINTTPILEEMARLMKLDPTVVLKEPRL